MANVFSSSTSKRFIDETAEKEDGDSVVVIKKKVKKEKTADDNDVQETHFTAGTTNQASFGDLRPDLGQLIRNSFYIWTIENYKESDVGMLATGKRISSPAFFTSHYGYKVKADIGENAGCLAVYMSLVTGPHDHMLQWPLKKSFKITIMNQVETQDNAVFFLRPKSEEMELWSQPKDDKRRGRGVNTIALATLRGNNYTSDFIRNDRVHIMIRLID